MQKVNKNSNNKTSEKNKQYTNKNNKNTNNKTRKTNK
jgi:hypothetical protein